MLHIYKNKDKFDVTNYHTMSILPVISKVYEQVFYNRLYNYFFVNSLLISYIQMLISIYYEQITISAITIQISRRGVTCIFFFFLQQEQD